MTNVLITILLASFKFALTFPLAVLEFHFSFAETILWMNLGGLLGIYFFAFLSEGVNRLINNLIRHLRRKKILGRSTRKKKIFTKRNRRIIRIKQKYGLLGIAATTPLLLSIPVGAFLVVRYYPSVKGRLLALIVSNFAWSLIYTPFYMFWKDMIFAG